MNPDEETSADLAGDALDLLDDIDTDSGDADVSIEDETPREDEELQEDSDDEQEDAEDDESDVSAEESEEGDKPKGKNRTQKRIDKLTREKNDARREADFAKRQAQESQAAYDRLHAYVQNLQATPEQIEQGAQQGLNAEQTQALIRQEATRQVEAERFNQIGVELTTKLRSGGAEDAMARLTNPALTPFEPESVIALHEAHHPVEVARAIAENEEVFSQFSKLTDAVARARFIDRIDGRLEANKARSRPSSEVKPTPKVRGAARAPEKDPDEMDQGEYEAWRRKQGWS